MHLRRPWLALALLVVAGRSAAAYTIKTSSAGDDLRWAEGEVVFTAAMSPSPSQVPAATGAELVATSVATWEAALASTTWTLRRADAPGVAAPHVADGTSSVRWAIATDDPDIEPGRLANTFVSYRSADGEILDADIVLDAVHFHWTTAIAGCGNEYDVQSAVTHELGHALGLAHSIGHPDATMFATGDACDAKKRDLDPDDIAAIDALYTPSAAGGCAATGRAGGWLVAGALAGLLCARRRRRSVIAPVVALAFGWAGTARAAQLVELPLAVLGDQAAMVVRGHVVASSPGTGPAIETVSTLIVDECLAGPCPAAAQIVRRGGERDGVGLWVDGEAAPALGADVVLYLRVDARGRLRVLGGIQGELAVTRVGAVLHVVRDLRAHELSTGGRWEPGRREDVELAALRAGLAHRHATRD